MACLAFVIPRLDIFGPGVLRETFMRRTLMPLAQPSHRRNTMNRLTMLALSALLLGWSGTPRPRAEYELVWADEFSHDGWPDPRNWTYERGFVRNQELQWYQADNAVVRDGVLVIEARKEARPNPSFEPGSTDWKRVRERIEYSSASLTTRGLHSWRYGRFEMRAKIDVRAGLWPAFWTIAVERHRPARNDQRRRQRAQSASTASSHHPQPRRRGHERGRSRRDAVPGPVRDRLCAGVPKDRAGSLMS